MVESYFKCTTDGFFPDKTDCWVYHICDGGTHSVRACEEDLYFNSKTGLCDWPMNVDCKQSTPKQTTKAASSTKTTNSKSQSSKVSPNNKPKLTTAISSKDAEDAVIESSAESICSNEDYGYMPHPKDCRKYIYCQEGTAKVFTCQGGLLWKQTDGNCVWPLDSDCPSLLVKKTTSSAGNPNFPNQNQPNSPASLALLKENFGTIECPADTTGFYANPYDCSAYHFCNGGKDQVILCEPGLHYRQDKQVCDWSINSNCIPKCPSNMDKYRFIDPKSCCRYFECVNGRLVVQLCQYPLLFDMQTKQCLDYSKVKCGIRKDCTNPCQYFTNEDPSLCEMVPNCNGKPQGVYLDQNRPSCQFFYTCRDNRVFNHTRCSGNLKFNQFEGRCMPPNMVACDAFTVHMGFGRLQMAFMIVAFIFSR
jgi:hypothetical protein